jgi:hypothetical protein
MKKIILIITLSIFASISIMAQETVDRNTVIKKYDEVNRLETIGERREFLGKQSEEMKIALWLENIDRKTEGAELSAEQSEIIDVIKEKFVTVEYARSVKGTSEADASDEYKELMSKANKLLGKKLMGELFGILGDIKTLKM